MKLELKHVAPYLPYKLNYLVWNGKAKPYIQEMKEMRTYTPHVFANIESKPILRPLLDLQNEEFKNRILNREYIIENGADANLSYYEWSYLFEEHFDIFGLIKKNIAIDINTLKK